MASISICPRGKNKRPFDKLDRHVDPRSCRCIHPSAYSGSQPAVDDGGKLRRQMKDAHGATFSSTYFTRTARKETAPVWVCNPMKPERGSWVAARPRFESLFVKVDVVNPFSATV